MKNISKRLLFVLSMFLLFSFVSLSSHAKWENDSIGWWYSQTDGSYYTNCWFLDSDQSWYHFDESGYMNTGWFLDPNGHWYFFDANGKMISNSWLDNNGKQYYLDSTGSMLTNSIAPDGRSVDANGEVVLPTITSNVPPVYYEPETTFPTSGMVWIPRTGSKYHSNEYCSNMKNPSHVSLQTAIQRGYDACSKCY